jgi:tetratricopeptide (TPR) repeat protein
MSNNFDDDFDDDFEDEEEGGPAGETFEEMLMRLAASGNLTTRHVSDDGEEGESHEISVADFLAQMSGVSQSESDEDEEDDEDDEDSGRQNLFFGIGQNGEVTNMTDEEGGFSFSFTLDQDGEDVPEVRCPKCNKKDTDVLDWDTDTYKCNSCGHEFVPEIYKVLDTAEDYLNRAWRNFKERNYKRTIKDATKAIALDPNLTLAYTIRGKALGAREEYQEAEKDFSEAIRISPDDDNAHFSRGETRLYLEKYDEAIEDLSVSIGFDPDFADTYVHRGNAYFKKENYPQAIEDFSEAIEREPDNASAIFQRGYTYSMLSQDDKALADYNTAIELNPDDEDSFVRRAELHERNGRFQEAITDYKNFLRSAGGEPDPVIIERIKALQLKLDPNAEPVAFDPDEEVSIWEDVTLSEDSKVYRSGEHGEKLIEQGDFAGAYKEFSDFIAHQPKNVSAYIHRACVSFAAGNCEGVIEDFTGAIICGAAIYPQKGPFSDSVDPRYDQIHLLRALSYALAGQEENILPDLIADAKSNFDKSYTSKNWSRRSSNLTANDAAAGKFVRMVLKETENNRTPVQDALLARLTNNVEDFGTATELLVQNDPQNPILIWAFGLNQEGNEDHPVIWDVPLSYPDDNAEIQFVRGLKSMTAGEFKRGKELMVEAIRLDPDNAEYHEKLGVFLARANEQDDAIGHLTKAIELNPNAKDAYFYRGIVHKFRDEFSEAQADFLQVIELESAPGNTFSEDARQQIDELKALEAKKEHFQNLKAKQNEPLETAAKYIERGQTYLKTGEWEKAYLDFGEAIRLEPTNAEAFRFRGASLYKMGEAELAIKDYSQAIKLDPNNSDLHLSRGILQADSGDSDDALVDLNEAIRLDPSNAMAYHMRAKVHAEAWYDGDSIDQATDDFEKAIELNPNDPQVYVSRAEFWGQPCFRGAEDDALADLDQAICLAPDNAEYYLARFKVKAKLNDATGASEDLTKAFLLDPSNEEVKESVQKLTSGSDKAQAAIFAQSGLDKYQGEDYEGCIHDMSEAIKNDPSTEVYFSLRGLAYNQLDMEDEALSDFSEAINLDTKNDEIFLKRGIIYAERDLPDEALGDFDKAISLGSEEPIVFLRRGFLYLEKELIDEAINDFTKSIELDPSLMSYVARSNAYLQQKSYDLAISDMSKAIELDPGYDNAYLQRGFSYQQLEDYKSATEDYEVYLRITEDDDFREEITELIKEWKDNEAPNSSHKREEVNVEKKQDSTLNDIQQPSPETQKTPLSITETWMQMGKNALEKGLYPDAVLNFDKVIKKEPYNWEATIYYWRAVGGQTDFENEAWDIFFENINQIKSYILNRLTGNERQEALLLIAESVHWYTDLFMNLVKERRDKRLYDLENQADINTLLGSINMFFGGIGRLEDSLTFLDSMQEIEFQGIKHAINKSKIDWITTLCEPVKARMRPSKDGFAYTGIPDDVRFKYIAKYETILDEIVKVEPEYKPEKLIDRLTAPTSTQEALNRPAELAKKQISIDKARQIRIAEFEKQKYWETHPEEYAAYLEEEKRKKEEEKARVLAEEQRNAEARKARALAEQKRKQELFEERKQKLQKEIDEHNLKLEVLKRETGSEIERLRKERDSLGFLAMGKKKEIDQKIHSLENQFLDFATKAEALKKQLKDLKP